MSSTAAAPHHRYITGRIKEQYKLENGKYVMPRPLEECLRSRRSSATSCSTVPVDERPRDCLLTDSPFTIEIAILDRETGLWWSRPARAAETDLRAAHGSILRA
jgi:hypothetical protein